MKLDLDGANVFEIEASVNNVRAYFDDNSEIPGLEDALDNAQGNVHTGELQEAYVVIKVVR